MKRFVVYDNTTGKIFRVGTCDDDALSAQAVETFESVLEVITDPIFNLHYVDISGETHTVNTKTDSTATISKTTIDADSIDFVLIDNIPNPTTVSITVPQGATSINPIVVVDGDLSFYCNFAGVYEIKLVSVPHLDKTFTITAS